MKNFPDTIIPNFIARQEANNRQVEILRLVDQIQKSLPFSPISGFFGADWYDFLTYIRNEYLTSEAYAINSQIRNRSITVKNAKSVFENKLFNLQALKTWLIGRCLMYDIVYFGNKVPFDTWVYRGATFTPDQLSAVEQSTTLVWPSFTSTTTSFDVASSFAHNKHIQKDNNIPCIFILMLPSGTPCHNYGWTEHNTSEREILLPPNIHVDILYAHKDRDTTTNIRYFYGIVQEYIISPLTPTFSEFVGAISNLVINLEGSSDSASTLALIGQGESILHRLDSDRYQNLEYPNLISSVQSAKAKAGTHYVGYKINENDGHRQFHWVK